MRARRASQTASMVALLRALADRGLTTVPGFSDPFAGRLLSPRWRLGLTLAERALARAPPEQRFRDGHLDTLPLRVVAIDAELERAVHSGCRQVVILGAGLDTRAYRLPWLAGVTLFEVDHPGTQAAKRRRAAKLEPVVARLVYVPVDFERDRLVEKLAAAGHRPELPTAWIWEGVVMYLSDDGFRASLRAVSEASAPGSVLLVHYHEPGGGSPRAMRLLLRLWSEPQIGLRPRGVMAGECRKAGFTVERDSGGSEWMARFGAQPVASSRAMSQRLLVVSRP